MLPYFVRAECNTRLGGPYHGQHGPLHVEDRRYTHPLSAAWVESAVTAGMKRTDDFNGAEQEGVGPYQVTCRRGVRWSTYDAYLMPTMERSNFTVVTGALATGLQVYRPPDRGSQPGRRAGHTVCARHEVLLCGGAINSPQLLMLSGIGPAAHLAEVGLTARSSSLGSVEHAGPPLHPDLWHTRARPTSPSSPRSATCSSGRPGVRARSPPTSPSRAASSARRRAGRARPAGARAAHRAHR